MAAVDLFLKIDGIAGESTDTQHRHEIEALAFSWAEHLLTSAGGGGGGGVGKVQIGDLQVLMRASAASPALMLSCASGKHHASATLAARRRGGGKQKDFLVITMKDVLVTSYRVGATESGEDDAPTDQVSIGFRTVTYTYTPIDAKGATGAPVTVSWDTKANAPATAAARTRKKAT